MQVKVKIYEHEVNQDHYCWLCCCQPSAKQQWLELKLVTLDLHQRCICSRCPQADIDQEIQDLVDGVMSSLKCYVATPAKQLSTSI